MRSLVPLSLAIALGCTPNPTSPTVTQSQTRGQANVHSSAGGIRVQTDGQTVRIDGEFSRLIVNGREVR
ncbi:hypothetical protein [Stieleria mannarensis]|uniref:hypothetical protein n=1 Tax=Stieleria mannarensis TaxID=2755585 RepID=UPI001601A558|nr:hypothetical protein [Rhodopirellula sp. JC639]